MKTKTKLIAAITIIALTSMLLASSGCFFRPALEQEKSTVPQETATEEQSTEKQVPEQEDNVADEKISPEPEQEEQVGGEAEQESNSFFAYAILKSYDAGQKKLYVEQLINEPNQQEIGDQVTHSSNCQAILSVLVRNGTEAEYVQGISIEDIPTGQEVGLDVKNGVVEKIIYQLWLDESQQAEVKPVDGQNEFFANAILKGIVDGSTLLVEQLVNEPNQKEIGENIVLAQNSQTYFSAVIRSNGQEKEIINAIDIYKIPRNQEVGLIVGNDTKVSAVIYSLVLE
ncbi:MAG: hypothetical protein PHN32_02530 [Actinomycetota bacterium]|nr:hypothetical protein [Actinomycetota bacterium]